MVLRTGLILVTPPPPLVYIVRERFGFEREGSDLKKNLGYVWIGGKGWNGVE
jgi:hypothetical protein